MSGPAVLVVGGAGYIGSYVVKILQKEISSRFNIMTNTKVVNIDISDNSGLVTFQSKDGKKSLNNYNKILVCVGRSPNTKNLDIESTGIKINKEGFIDINSQCRTLIPNIFAIGDVAYFHLFCTYYLWI